MVYTDTMLPVFQRKSMYYFFLFTTNNPIRAVGTIPTIDHTFKPIGPTILVEWEE